MRTIDAEEGQTRLDELLKEAQQQPIVIRQGGQDLAAVVSIAFYDQLRALEVEAFFALRSQVAEEATSAGLTPERLADLLRDEQ
jgi:prevent-host-death family protein